MNWMKKPYHPFYKLLFLAGMFVCSAPIVAQVLPADSLALVNLYNSTGGSTWYINTHWLAGPVPTWYGVAVTGARVSEINLPSDNLAGAVPASIANLDSLKEINFSGNNLTSFPVLTGLHLDSLSLQNNQLTFKDLVPNKALTDSFYYSPQDSVDVAEDTTVIEQSRVTLVTNVDDNPLIGDSYHWYLGTTSVVASGSNTYTISCMDSADAGTYYCAITNSQLSKLTLYRRFIEVNIQRLATPDSSFHVCDSLNTLSGVQPAGSTVLWSLVSGGGVIASDTSATTAVTGLSVGPNVFQYAVSANNISCPALTFSTALLTITRDTNPSPAYAGANLSVCGSHVELNADSPSVGIGTWTVISLGTASVSQPNDPVTAVNGLSPGVNIFRWQIVNGACAPAFFSEVKVFRDDTLSNISAGRDTSICFTSYQLIAPLPADAHWAWSVVQGAGAFAQDSSAQVFENDTTITTPVSGLSDTLNTFMWTVSNTCNSISANVNVTVYPFTIANAGPNENIFYSPINTYTVGDSLPVATGGNGQYTYVWSPATNLDSADVEHPQFLTPSAGSYTYSVTVTDGHGCTATASVTYTVTENQFLAVPSLFTPNGDGVNDVLYIPGIESYPDNTLTVVDRNDQVVYKKQGYTNDWGGINELGFSRQGELLPADTYYYTLNLDNGKPTQTGFFLIKY
jgi:gliding motility-associated-like protein